MQDADQSIVWIELLSACSTFPFKNVWTGYGACRQWVCGRHNRSVISVRKAWHTINSQIIHVIIILNPIKILEFIANSF